MSEGIKDTVNENAGLMEKNPEVDNHPEDKISFYAKFMARLSMVGTGALIFMLAFLKATKITGFDSTKLFLFEVCLFILVLALICIAVVLALIHHKCTAHRIVALLIYVSGLYVIMLTMIFWAFFKATW